MTKHIIDVSHPEEYARLMATWKRGRVVLLFWDPSSEPCRIVREVCEELAAELAQDVRFAAVQGEALAQQSPTLNTWELPTVLILQDGEVECKFIGISGSRFTFAMSLERQITGMGRL
jgi:thioredoxin-like negative regulator of GroEL